MTHCNHLHSGYLLSIVITHRTAGIQFLGMPPPTRGYGPPQLHYFKNSSFQAVKTISLTSSLFHSAALCLLSNHSLTTSGPVIHSLSYFSLSVTSMSSCPSLPSLDSESTKINTPFPSIPLHLYKSEHSLTLYPHPWILMAIHTLPRNYTSIRKTPSLVSEMNTSDLFVVVIIVVVLFEFLILILIFILANHCLMFRGKIDVIRWELFPVPITKFTLHLYTNFHFEIEEMPFSLSKSNLLFVCPSVFCGTRTKQSLTVKIKYFTCVL